MLKGGSSDTPAEHRRDFVYVDDVAQAIKLAVLRDRAFGGVALNISGGQLTHGTVVSAVEEALENKVPMKTMESGKCTVDPPLPAMDISAARRELSWEPRVSITDGVKRYAKAFGNSFAEDSKPKRDLQPWLGLWRWDTPNCVKALEFYKFWGTMTDVQAEECATSIKEFRHSSIEEGRLEVRFKAADTTRNTDFGYEITIDGKPHEIDPLLCARANNSIKLNPTGRWAHWWEGDYLIMEQPCIVREKLLIHRLTRVLNGDALHCHELVFDRESGEELLTAVHAYVRVPP